MLALDIAHFRTPALTGDNMDSGDGFCPACDCTKGGDASEPNVYTDACRDTGCRCHTECPTCGQRTIRPYRIGGRIADQDCPICYPNDPNLRCRCGAKTDSINRDVYDKCPKCGTFSSTHDYYGGEDSDFRCYECDVRYGSHR